jgi:RNA polymerase sigma factor for flagellar operon FliA
MNEDPVAKKVSSAYARASKASGLAAASVRDFALRYLDIVRSEVLRFKMRVPRHIELEELHGVAICGLMNAYARFREPHEEAHFGAYVRQRVRGAILDELRRLDHMTRSARRKARVYDDAQRSVEQREGRLATEGEIRSELGLSKEAFDAFLEELRPITFFSLDEHRTDADGMDLVEKLEDPTEVLVPERMESDELLQSLRDRLDALPDTQRKVLHMYYFKDFRLAEIAEVFAVSESRICQIHTQAIRSLRQLLQRELNSETS